MGRRLYVGNLPYSAGEAELQELFSSGHGRIGPGRAAQRLAARGSRSSRWRPTTKRRRRHPSSTSSRWVDAA
jgi:hypothetical protein